MATNRCTACGQLIGFKPGTPYVYTYTQNGAPKMQRAVVGETVVEQPEQVFHESCFRRVQSSLGFEEEQL